MTSNPSRDALGSLPARARENLLDGICNPCESSLTTGTIIVRFANSSRWPDRWTASPWWVREIDFRRIEAARGRSLRIHDGDPTRALTMGFLGKQALAVPQQWRPDGPPNLMDVVVRAEVLKELPCFVGQARVQREVAPNGFRLTWGGWPAVEQIFIPHFAQHPDPLIGPWRKPEEPVLRVLQSTLVSSQQLY
jgi:hypothetical protein